MEAARLIGQANRVEKQAILLLRALHSIYVALGAFAGATLITLLGASLTLFHSSVWNQVSAITGIALGTVGVGGLVYGSMNLLAATRLSLFNLREEAELIRDRQGNKPHRIHDENE